MDIEQIFGEAKYPDIFIYVCIPIIVGILTIALPLLIQIVNRLDDKYGSSTITKIFNRSCQYKLFIYTLIVSIGLIFLFILHLNVSWEER